MKKNAENNGGSNAKKLMNVALACAAVVVAIAPIPPAVKAVVLTTSIPTWLRGHVFF